MSDSIAKSKALNLLKQAAQALTEVSESQQTDNIKNNKPEIHVPTSHAPPTASEIKKLFSPYSSYSRPGTRPSSTKKHFPATVTSVSGPVSFWTHRFSVIIDKDQNFVPTREQKKESFENGLGEKKVTFEKNDNPLYFKEKLESVFPALKSCGGYELLRTEFGSRSSLELMIQPSTGFHTNYLANESCLGQAMCYARPIQRNLAFASVSVEGDDLSQGPTEVCIICNDEIPLKNLRRHVEDCDKNCNNDDNDLDILPEINFKPMKKSQQPICKYTCVPAVKCTENLDETPAKINYVQCPLCQDSFNKDVIEIHSSTCNGLSESAGENDKQSEVVTALSIRSEDENVHRERCLKETLLEMCDIKSPDLIISTYSKKFIRGKKMDVLEEDYDSKENTAFEIFISRDDIFNDMLSEFSRNVDISYLLDVTFIGEEASDMGGPRREFLTLALQAIKERLIKDGYLVSEKDIGHEAYLTLLHKKAFEIAGIVVGLSLLEGGPVPYLLIDPRGVLLTPDTQEMKQFSIGLKRIGILQLCQIKKDLMSLFDMNNGKTLLLTYPTLVKLLKVKFSEEGSNGYIQEKSMYRFFLDYMKEVAAHRRGSIQLSDILKFITGIDQVPILGFTNTPTIEFTASDTLLPTSSTCTCTLNLSRKCDVTKDIVFNMFDYAFANSYFGLV